MKSSIRSIAARVFTHPKYPKMGGNPVTIFVLPPVASPSSSSSSTLSSLDQSALRKKLAQSCLWESVIVDYGSIHTDNLENNSKDTAAVVVDSLQKEQQQQQRIQPPRLHFYMPSGEEVSFCAHAAMGAAMVIYQQDSIIQNDQNSKITFQTCDGVHHSATIFLHNQRVELTMKHDLKENQVDHDIVAKLLHLVGLKMEHVDTAAFVQGPSTPSETMEMMEPHQHSPPLPYPLVNSSVSRYKTLVPIATLDILHSATNPKDADEFRTLCDSIGSTGLYLYSPVPTLTENSGHDDHPYEFECRQFPRASGYPEDPATGIAASALACSLYKRGMGQKEGELFIIHQGTAMKRPSRCLVKIHDDLVFCSGSIELDEKGREEDIMPTHG